MLIDVILENPGGELGRERLEVAESVDDFDGAVDDAVSHVLEGWIFSVGDTIRIVEVAA